ncbi:hypothetical protein [Flaviaesturariibacter terrae]
MHRSLNLLLALLVFCATASAQLDAVSRARLQTTSGTLRGYVRNRPKIFTPQYFDFSESATGPWRRFDASALERVELEDSTVFERHHVRVPVLAKPVSLRQKSDYTPNVYLDGGLLLEQLVDGNPDLFEYTDSFEVAHFFYRGIGDTALQPIVYEPYEDPYDKGQFGYRNELERLGIRAGCGEAAHTDINYVSYETADMIRYFEQLNACSGGRARVVGRLNKKRSVVRAGIEAGGWFASQYIGLPYDQAARVHTLSGVVGAWIDFLPRRQNTNLLIGMGLSLLTGSNDFQPGTKELRIPHAELSYKAVYLEVTVRRLFGDSRQRPFLESGLMMGGYFSGELHYVVQNPSGGIEQYNSRLGGTSTEAMIGAGLQLPAGSLHLRYGQPLVGNNPFRDRNLSLLLRLALKR